MARSGGGAVFHGSVDAVLERRGGQVSTLMLSLEGLSKDSAQAFRSKLEDKLAGSKQTRK